MFTTKIFKKIVKITIGIFLVWTLGGTRGIQTVHAQSSIVDTLFTFDGAAPGYWLGQSVTSVPDVNGDGIPDLLIGAPDFHVSWRPGHAYLLSGADGSAIFTFFENIGGDRLGYSVAPAGDITQDGIGDLIIAAPGHTSRTVYIYSGADGSQILAIHGADYWGDVWDTFGISAASAGDVNGDSIPDIIVGSPYANPGGRRDAGIVYVFSGTNGALLYRFEGEQPYDFIGISVLSMGDINSDGYCEFAMGAPATPTDYYWLNRPGSVLIFSGADEQRLLRIDGEATNDLFGWSLADAGDLNNDGISELIIGTNSYGFGYVGKAYIYSIANATATRLFTFSGDETDDVFGARVANARDLNGDGVQDIIIGAPYANPSGIIKAGSVSVYSGANGNLLFRFDGNRQGDVLGYAVASAGDLNNDGRSEVLVSASGESSYYEESGGYHVTGRVYVLSYTPPPVANAGSDRMALEGEMMTLDASGSTDPDNNIASYEWDLDNDGDYDDAVGMTAQAGFPDDGIYTVGLKVTDDYGEFDTDTAEITVTNVLPVVNAGPDTSLNEGDTFIGSGSFTDPGADIWTATVNYGAGAEPLVLNPNKTFTLSQIYADNGIFPVEICVTDDDAGIGCDTVEVTVFNVDPTITSIIGPVNPVQIGTSISFTGEFTDPGTADTFTATWNWGDGSSSAGAVTNYAVSGSYVFSATGVYTLTLTVSDVDGGSDIETFQYIVIYDPNGGFVTGGGWITSPLGAYIADPSLTGKATFGFVSKYQNGANVPTGNTEFLFHVANMNFKSTLYDWLVIAGTKAQYKGTGTINGAGNYGFILTAIDGQVNGGGGVDKFRIKIWDKATGQIIYDNMPDAADDAIPTTALGGGSIVIHK